MKKVAGIILIVIGVFYTLGGTVTFFRESNFDISSPYAAGKLMGRLSVPLLGVGAVFLGLKMRRKPIVNRESESN